MTIDWWTLALQTVNFLVLVWILARFFFRPVRQIIAERQQAAGKIMADAEAARHEATQTLSDAKQARADIERGRDKLMAGAHADAEHERDRLLADAKAESERLVGEAKAAAERQRAAMDKELIDEVRDLSVEIAGRLLARLPSNEALDMFVDALCERIAKLKPDEHAEFVANGPAEVVTAAALAKDEEDRVAHRLQTAFGTPMKLAFRADPSIVAGIELNAAHAFIRSSWREDLDHIRVELSHERTS